jgi:hypothetical protein
MWMKTKVGPKTKEMIFLIIPSFFVKLSATCGTTLNLNAILTPNSNLN